MIATNLGRHMPLPMRMALAVGTPLVMKNIPQGAATQCFAAVHPKALPLHGQYLANCNAATPRADAEDEAMGTRLWDVSEKIAAEV